MKVEQGMRVDKFTVAHMESAAEDNCFEFCRDSMVESNFWTLKNVVRQDSIALIRCEDNNMSSIFTLQQSACLAVGRNFLGNEVGKKEGTKVLHFFSGGDSRHHNKILIDIARGLNFSSDEIRLLDDNLFLVEIYGNDKAELIDRDSLGNLKQSDIYEELYDMVKKHDITHVVFDPLYVFSTPNPYNNQEQSFFMKELKRLHSDLITASFYCVDRFGGTASYAAFFDNFIDIRSINRCRTHIIRFNYSGDSVIVNASSKNGVLTKL